MSGQLVCNLLLLFVSCVTSYDRALCQAPTHKPLKGCPKNTLLVGPNENFLSVQDAVLSIPHNNVPSAILILAGNYTEQVNVTRPGPLTLLGQTNHPNDATLNQVNIIWHSATGTPETGDYDNAFTSVLTIAPTLNASFTGSGPTGNPVPPDTPFGNKDFRTYNLNFINGYRPYSAGPSLALSVSYANAGFYYTEFLSYQDTVRKVVTSWCGADDSPGVRWKTRQRIHVRVHRWGPDRLLLRLRYTLGHRLTDSAPRLRWRYHCLEGHQYHIHQQIWRLHS